MTSEKVEALAKGRDDEGLIFETSEDVEVLPTFDALGFQEDCLEEIMPTGLSDHPPAAACHSANLEGSRCHRQISE